jgi:hypothetical protein
LKYTFFLTDKKVFLGSQFCRDHDSENSPSIPATILKKENVASLRKTKNKVKDENTADDIFNVAGMYYNN